MCVVVAHGAIHFGLHGHICNFLACAAQANHHVGQLFANGGRAGCLSMGSAEHGHGCISMRHAAQLFNDVVKRRQHHLMARTFELQSMAGVVDVFAGACKVNKL